MLAAAFSLFAIQQASSQTKTNMEQTKTIRLVYPQWQGGKIEQWITEISDPKEAAQGYALGAELMNWLAPENPEQKTLAVSALTGNGDATILQPLKGKIEPKNILYAGFRDWERPAMEVRAREMGMTVLSPAEVRQNSDKVVEWLRSTGAKHLLIHFDLDVLDPADIIAAVGTTPDGMKISEVVRIITDAARQSDLVGLTIAENMPRTAIRLRQMLRELPLFK